MQQLGFRFEPVPARIPADGAQVFACKLDESGRSFVEIGVKPNSDGTWSRRTSDNFHRWCGQCGPFYGAFETFDDAFRQSVSTLARSFPHSAGETRDGVQTETHRAMARRGLKWLEDLAAGHQIDLNDFEKCAVPESPAEQDMK